MIKKMLNIAFYIIAVFYVFLMLDLFFRINIISSGDNLSHGYNLIPFRTILDYTGGGIKVSRSIVGYNIFGNIAVFIPYALYLQTLLKNKSFIKSFFIVIVTSFAIETIQFVYKLGAADIDDIILNVSGGIIGIIGYKLLRLLLRDDYRTKLFISSVSVVIGLPIMFVYLMICIIRYF